MTHSRSIVLLLISLLLLSIPSVFAQQRIYVAADGNDKNNGSQTSPLQTPGAALEKLSSKTGGKIEIILRKGVYRLSSPIVLTADMLHGHQLSIHNFEHEKVIVSGAAVLPQLKWSVYKDSILKCEIGKDIQIDQLFCNGKIMPMARYPNFDSAARVFNGTASDAISKEKVRKWADPRGGYVHALHQAEWGDFHYIVKGKAEDTLVLEGGWQNNRPAPMHADYRFVENIFEELDAPGEWFYNSGTGILFFYPPRDVNIHQAVFERSVVNELIRVEGSEERPTENINISGLTFTGTNRTFMLRKDPLLRTDWTIYRGGAILIEGGKNIRIGDCRFTQLGGNAVFVSRYNRDVTIEHNVVTRIGANAFSFIGDTGAVRSPSFRYEQFVPLNEMDMKPGSRSNAYPASCRIYDNLIFNIGTVEKQIAGIEIDIASGIVASHNTIYNVPRAGINIGDGCFGGHVIEYNDVFNTVLETGDHGAFNSWGRDRFWLPDVRDVDQQVDRYPSLPFADITQPNVLRNNRFQCEHGWDIDLDDGSSRYRIYNNLCLNGGLKLREGFDRIVENNILVNNTFHPHAWYRKSMDIFAHNIVTTEYAPFNIEVWGKEVDSNLFIQKAALIAAQQNKTDQHSIVGDPQFINEKAGDFRVKPGSIALTIGFRNSQMDSFGVVSLKLKQEAAKPAIVPIRTLTEQKKGATTEWLGATLKNVETLGEQSAAGLPDKNGALIVKVKAGSIAFKNGLSPGDVIRRIDDKDVNTVAEMLNELQTTMWHGSAGAAVWHHQQLTQMKLALK